MELLQVIEQNKIKQLKGMITDKRINLNETVKDQRGKYVTSPLIQACQCENYAILDLLFEHGADVNKPCQTPQGTTALYVACEKGDLKLVKYLIDKHASVDQQIRQNKISPLHTAIRGGHINIARVLVKNGADVNVLSAYGTPLFEAAEQSSMQCATLLLDNGADVNKTAKTNETPLHKSTEMEYISMMELLLRRGADASIKLQHNQFTPLCVAVERKKNVSLQFLLKQRSVDVDVAAGGKTPLGMAAETENIEGMKMLISRNADIDMLPEMDDETVATTLTPLMIAVEQGHRRAMDLLLQKGAQVNIINQAGNTALHYAVFDCNAKEESKKLKLSMMLLKHKASPRIRNKLDVSPFYYALRRRMFSILELFLGSGANPNEGDINQSTAFHHLADCAEVYPLLAKFRADANKTNIDGQSALHLAAASYNTKAENLDQLMSEFGATVTQNNDGEFPYHVAKTFDNIEVFRKKGFDLNVQTVHGDTTLHCMVKNRFSCSEVKKLLKMKCLDVSAINGDGLNAADVANMFSSNTEIVKVLTPEDSDKKDKQVIISPRKSISKKVSSVGEIKDDKTQLTSRQDTKIKTNMKNNNNNNNNNNNTSNSKNEKLKTETEKKKSNDNIKDEKNKQVIVNKKSLSKKNSVPNYAKATASQVNRLNDTEVDESGKWDKMLRGGGEQPKPVSKNNNKATPGDKLVTTEGSCKVDGRPMDAALPNEDENGKIASETEDVIMNADNEGPETLLENAEFGEDKTSGYDVDELHLEGDDIDGDADDGGHNKENKASNTNVTNVKKGILKKIDSVDSVNSSGGKKPRSCSFADISDVEMNEHYNNNNFSYSVSNFSEAEEDVFRRRERFCSFYESPTSDEDEVLYEDHSFDTERESSGVSTVDKHETEPHAEVQVPDGADTSTKVKGKEPITPKIKKLTKKRPKKSEGEQEVKAKTKENKDSESQQKVKLKSTASTQEKVAVKKKNSLTEKPKPRKKRSEGVTENSKEIKETVQVQAKFYEVAVLFHPDVWQKADQICEYIKRRGRLFLAQQPAVRVAGAEEQTEAMKMEKAEKFKTLMKQSKIILLITTDNFKSSQECLEYCQYADRLQRLVLPLRLQGDCKYQTSSLLDLMVGDKYHFDVGQQYEQEMEKLLNKLKEKLHL